MGTSGESHVERNRCPVYAAMRVIAGRWKPMICRRLGEHAHGFGELHRAMPGVTAKVLRQQLRQLQADGIVARKTRREPALSVRYRLTPHGRTLRPVFETLWGWGTRHLARATQAVGVMMLLLVATPAGAAELKPSTVAAFDRYVRLTEARMAGELGDAGPFLLVDGVPAPRRGSMIETLRRGEFLIERQTTRDAGKQIDVPDGLIHHWVGLVFVPGATVDQAVTLLQDYDRHGEIYRPAVARSKLVARDGDVFRVYLRFFMKKVITVVMNSDHEARYTRPRADRAYSRIYSTRIAEVENPDTPQEREKPVGNDSGYLWRLYSYWRFLQRDGGTYVQCESISLTRGIPIGVGWLVRPFVTSIPRESLTFTLETTRKVLARQAASASR